MFDSIRRHEPWLESYIPTSGDTALDIGANTGTWAYDLSWAFKHVHAYEPHPDAFTELVRNVEGLGNVFTHECAVSDTMLNQKLILFEESVHTSSEAIVDAARSNPIGQIEVMSVELDGVDFGNEEIDFVKIDTEGHEVRALTGMIRTLKKHRPTLLVEYHSQRNLHDCTDVLGSLGYAVKHISHPHGVVGHGWIYAT